MTWKRGWLSSLQRQKMTLSGLCERPLVGRYFFRSTITSFSVPSKVKGAR